MAKGEITGIRFTFLSETAKREQEQQFKKTTTTKQKQNM